MGYRICKNKYGYYKIQRQQKRIELLGITFRKEWVNCCFSPIDGTRLIIFDSVEKAQEQIDKFVKNNQRLDKDWICM